MPDCGNNALAMDLQFYFNLWSIETLPFKVGALHVSAWHYIDVIMGTMASQIISLAIVYSIVYSGADQRKHQSSASLAFVRGIHRWPVNLPHKEPVTRKMFPFDDIIMARTEQGDAQRENTTKVTSSLIGQYLVEHSIRHIFAENNPENIDPCMKTLAPEASISCMDK